MRVLVLSVCVLLLISTTEVAGQVSAFRVSGTDPFSDCLVGAPGTNYLNAAVEPFVAVNPANPSNIIGVYQQDRWDNGGSRGIVTSYSKDEGASWSNSFAHLSICAGGAIANGGFYERASDPWVTISPNGVAYQTSISFNVTNPGSAVLVSSSVDGGATWSDPRALVVDSSGTIFNDKDSVTADPGNSSNVYAVWDQIISQVTSDPNSFTQPVLFSRTTDGGNSWDAARVIYAPGLDAGTVGNVISVLPDGHLVDAFALINKTGAFLEVVRSTDRGGTWSLPTVVSPEAPVLLSNPDNSSEVLRTGGVLPSLAVDRNKGTLYLVWENSEDGIHNHTVMSMSTDEGVTWSPLVAIDKSETGDAFTPVVSVDSSGAVGVSYYDYRNYRPASGFPVDSWFVSCASSCKNASSWVESHVAGPFPMEAAPSAGGLFLGDYQGIAASGNTFLLLYAATVAGNLGDRTDIFVAPIAQAGTSVSCAPAVVGTPTLCKATVTGSSPSGTVVWSTTGGGRLSAKSCKLVKSSCTLKLTPVSAVSPSTVTASYQGNKHNLSSNSTITFSATKRSTSVGVVCSSANFGISKGVKCTARVSGYLPSGNVTWSQIGGAGFVAFSAVSCQLAKGTCSVMVEGKSSGNIVIKATYNGDLNNLASSKPKSLRVK